MSDQPLAGSVDRERFAALADAIIPGTETDPAPSALGLEGKWLDRVLTARPDLEPLVVRAIGASSKARPEQAVAMLRASAPDEFRALRLAVIAAYYLHPKVRRAIGYPGQKSNPAFPDEAEYYLDGDILAPVVARSPLYRDTP
ncbi:MAG: hypothetical protein ACRDJJ_01055 [Actinomycetota bacterium]